MSPYLISISDQTALHFMAQLLSVAIKSNWTGAESSRAVMKTVGETPRVRQTNPIASIANRVSSAMLLRHVSNHR